MRKVAYLTELRVTCHYTAESINAMSSRSALFKMLNLVDGQTVSSLAHAAGSTRRYRVGTEACPPYPAALETQQGVVIYLAEAICRRVLTEAPFREGAQTIPQE